MAKQEHTTEFIPLDIASIPKLAQRRCITIDDQKTKMPEDGLAFDTPTGIFTIAVSINPEILNENLSSAESLPISVSGNRIVNPKVKPELSNYTPNNKTLDPDTPNLCFCLDLKLSRDNTIIPVSMSIEPVKIIANLKDTNGKTPIKSKHFIKTLNPEELARFEAAEKIALRSIDRAQEYPYPSSVIDRINKLFHNVAFLSVPSELITAAYEKKGEALDRFHFKTLPWQEILFNTIRARELKLPSTANHGGEIFNSHPVVVNKIKEINSDQQIVSDRKQKSTFTGQRVATQKTEIGKFLGAIVEANFEQNSEEKVSEFLSQYPELAAKLIDQLDVQDTKKLSKFFQLVRRNFKSYKFMNTHPDRTDTTINWQHCVSRFKHKGQQFIIEVKERDVELKAEGSTLTEILLWKAIFAGKLKEYKVKPKVD